MLLISQLLFELVLPVSHYVLDGVQESYIGFYPKKKESYIGFHSLSLFTHLPHHILSYIATHLMLLIVL